MNEQLEKVKVKLQQEKKSVCSLKARVSELEVRFTDTVIRGYLVE